MSLFDRLKHCIMLMRNSNITLCERVLWQLKYFVENHWKWYSNRFHFWLRIDCLLDKQSRFAENASIFFTCPFVCIYPLDSIRQIVCGMVWKLNPFIRKQLQRYGVSEKSHVCIVYIYNISRSLWLRTGLFWLIEAVHRNAAIYPQPASASKDE